MPDREWTDDELAAMVNGMFNAYCFVRLVRYIGADGKARVVRIPALDASHYVQAGPHVMVNKDPADEQSREVSDLLDSMGIRHV